MQSYEGTFRTSDGLELFEIGWKPRGESKGSVAVVHGFGEHCARYFHAAEKLVQAGYSVYSFDLRGHGRSEGPRGFVRSFERYISDLDLFIGRLRMKEQDKPLFLVGHSMGGAIAAIFAAKNGNAIDGLILSSVLAKNPRKTSLFFVFSLSLLSKIFPTIGVIDKIKSSDLSRDPDVAEHYDSDPLVYHGKIAAREAAEMIKAIEAVKTGASVLSIPVLILYGTEDRVTDPAGSEELYRSAGSPDKTLKAYEGLCHEIMNEPEKERVLADIISWMDRHL